jgi:hypothetical protein
MSSDTKVNKTPYNVMITSRILNRLTISGCKMNIELHGSTGLCCNHCGRDGHIDAFCYRKKKAQNAQAHRSSHGTGGSSSEGSKRSSAGSDTQELLMLLRHLAASTLSGVVSSVTQPSALICSATVSQSFTLGPPFAPSPGIYPW